MADSAADQLRQVFSSPLLDEEGRRIVFWHDVEGSFAQEFEQLRQEGIGGAGGRKVLFADASSESLFDLKRRILRENREDDFLVYTRTSRDFSEGGLEGNWLADIELISEHFQADKASMLLGEVNAGPDARDAVARFARFFGAAERRAAYLKRMPETATPGDVAVGVVSTILKAQTSRMEDIVESLLCALHEGSGEQLLSDFEKYDALSALAALLEKRLGYTGDPMSEVALSEHLLLSAAFCTLPEDVMSGYSNRISRAHARFCLNIVRDWLDRQDTRSILYEICRRVEQETNLSDVLSGAEVSRLSDTDIFPCVNEVILASLLGSLAQGSDRSAEALAICQRRKNLKWYKRVACFFDLLANAAQAESFYREHPQGFHASNPVDAWKGYVSGWNSMDAIYRSFCASFDECQLSAEEVPDALRDAAEKTAERVENLYVNWFLPGVNGCWIGCCEPDWAKKGHVAGIPLQREFYNRYPSRNLRDFKRTVVIVSDGMRYEVGAELARRLEQETKGSVTLEACQSVFPSVTEFGMAALLPQSEISYSWNSGEVFADGMPTRTTKEREAVLQKAVPGARALTAQDLRAGNRAARRELVGSAPLVYIYQDKIDSTGEKPKLEHDVFAACESAVDELVALCKIVVNDLGINRVFVTADHGFLYTRRPLKEHDKIAKADIGSGDVQLHRRHVLSREAIDSNILVKMNMEDIHGGEYYGLALRECIRLKSVAGNKNYAHGGVSLQEMCVPVIEFRNHRSNSKARVDQEKATLSLVSTSRRITSSMFHVDLYQREPVSGKVLPCEYELCLTDGSGNPVTDIQKAHADMATPDERARVSRPMFTLKAGIDYPPDERYFLVCRDKETGEIAWKEEFTIDMAFAPSVDFGF